MGKVDCWRFCACNRGLTSDISSMRGNISYVVGCTPSSPMNTIQNTAHASIWEAASSQPMMGVNFFFPIIRLVSTKEVKV